MKLPDFTNDEALLALRRKMGANRAGVFSTSFQPEALTFEEKEKLEREGIDVDVKDVRVLKDGTLAYKDSRVLLHIRDVTLYGGKFEPPKFHIAWCNKLEEMHSNKRFGRYVVATRTDGKFQINRISSRSINTLSDEHLDVCQYCLGKLPIYKFSHSMPRSDRKKIVEDFSIDDFFRIFPKSLHERTPEYTDATAPINDYPPGFEEVSNSIREERNWTCEKCSFEALKKNERQYLHVHHLNGLKYDSNPLNLLVLCIGCHAEQPMHNHIKRSPAYKEFVSKYRSKS